MKNTLSAIIRPISNAQSLALFAVFNAIAAATGKRFRVVKFDAANVTIMPHVDADLDYFKSTDVVSVAIADLVTACTAPSRWARDPRGPSPASGVRRPAC